MSGDVSASLEDRFVAAGLRVLSEQSAADLTIRRGAEVAGSSTMGIYSRFGSRTGMLEAIYRRGFETLRDALAVARDGVPTRDPAAPPLPAEDRTGRILALARAYRDFALANPALYALMFERPLPDFDPSHELRGEALAMTFTLLTAELDGAVRPAYLVWTTIHGIVSIELTHALRSPLPGWFLDSPEVGAQVLTDGVEALLAGLRRPV